MTTKEDIVEKLILATETDSIQWKPAAWGSQVMVGDYMIQIGSARPIASVRTPLGDDIDLGWAPALRNVVESARARGKRLTDEDILEDALRSIEATMAPSGEILRESADL